MSRLFYVNIFKIITFLFAQYKYMYYIYIIIITQKHKTMIDLNKYSETNKTTTLSNGKEFKVYSKETKSGLRYFFYSPKNHRMMPVSKNNIK